MRDALKRIAREGERREPVEVATFASCHERQLAAQARRRQEADWQTRQDDCMRRLARTRANLATFSEAKPSAVVSDYNRA